MTHKYSVLVVWHKMLFVNCQLFSVRLLHLREDVKGNPVKFYLFCIKIMFLHIQ